MSDLICPTVSTYEATSGLLSSKTVGTSTTSYSYDKWGRKTTLTNTPETGTGDTTTWVYIPTGLVGAGQASLVTTPKSSYTYSYGANGETRSLPTSLAISGITEAYTAVYDEAGRMTTQTAPGGVSQTFSYDTAGRINTMSYLAKVSNGGTTTTVDWMDFTRTYDAQNRVSTETAPGIQPGINNDTVYQYGYSDRNRLVNVNQIDNNICVNRAYTFDNTGNRTQKVTSLLNADNNLCGTPVTGETPITQSLSYNDYSQLTNTGYAYDIFGRATTVPSSDTSSGTGNLSIGYSIEDRITSQKQGATQTDYNYDALGRRYQDKQNTVVQVTRHYGEESDNPNWVTSGPVGAITQTDVFTPSLGSSLNITRITKTGSTTAYLNFANLHGDTITSLVIPTSGYVSAPQVLNVFDEYGVNQPIDSASLPSGSTYADTRNLFITNYGSLGQAQRETTDTGIQFMGARGYNPTTGQFLTPDPIRGGNETPYNYPSEPISTIDLNGLMGLATHIALGFVASWAVGIMLEGLCIASVACAVIEVVAVTVAASVLASGAEAGMDRIFHGSKEPNQHMRAAKEGLYGAGAELAGRQVAQSTKKYRLLPTSQLQKTMSGQWGSRASLAFDVGSKLLEIKSHYDTKKKVNFSEEWIF